jgi:hypothetical protein
MKRSLIVVAVIAASAVLFPGVASSQPSPEPMGTQPAPATSAASVPAESVQPVQPVQPVQVAPIMAPAPAPARAPAHLAPAVTPTTTGPVTVATTSAPSTTSTSATSRTAYINAMYLSVVPAGERAALAGRYVLGYNLPGLACGAGCTGLFGGQARSSFNSTFFSYSVAYQRNTVAHEAAHAYGFLFISNYATPSWAAEGGWQAQFHDLDASFVRTYDAEAWAACVAWKESGFNNRVDQIKNVCTPQAATAAMAQIP